MTARTVIIFVALILLARASSAQAPEELLRRWVGTHEGRPLHFDFYGDTMLVVNDQYPLHFEVQDDTLRVWGDTAFSVTFWFAMDRLLVETIDSSVVTMAPQPRLARPLAGRWRGSPIASDALIEIMMRRGGTVVWLRPPIEGRGSGEWDRASRVITFTWEPDSTEWAARFDPEGGALLLDSLYPESGRIVLRRAYRW